MFLEKPNDLVNAVKNTNFSILVADPFKLRPLLKKAYKTGIIFLEPDEKSGKISVEMVRVFTAMTNTAEKSDRYFCVMHAEAMNEAAENAFLKNLEEPKPHHYFILVTNSPSSLLPTVLSRAQVFFLKESNPLEKPINADEKIKTKAKALISADAPKLIELANEISKKKDNPRSYALEIVGCAIEMLYKTYFVTNQAKFLKKLSKLLSLYENLEKNGHVKLHLVADML